MSAVVALHTMPAAAVGRWLIWALALLCLAGVKRSWAQGEPDGNLVGLPRVRFEIDVLPPPLAPRARAHSADVQTPNDLSTRQAGLGARWWLTSGSVAWGIGTELPGGPAGLAPRAVLAVRTEIGANARVGFDLLPAIRDAAAAEEPAERARLALEFRTTSAVRDIREGLLKLQLSNSSSLHFQPRRSGAVLSWRAQF